MAINKTNIVDLIGVDEVTGNIMLAIVDKESWGNPLTHLELLQDKIYAYLSFIESGEVFESYPNSKQCNFEILLYLKYQPCEIGKKFI
jgi:hypothetical protein